MMDQYVAKDFMLYYFSCCNKTVSQTDNRSCSLHVTSHVTLLRVAQAIATRYLRNDKWYCWICLTWILRTVVCILHCFRDAADVWKSWKFYRTTHMQRTYSSVSVCPSVTRRCCIETAERIDQVFGTEDTLEASYIVLQGNLSISKNKDILPARNLS